MTQPLSPLLETLREELTACLRGLTTEQTQLRPAGRPQAWSIQEVMEHLMLTYDLAGVAFKERLAKGRPSLRPVTLKERFFQALVVAYARFPPGRQAPELVKPEHLPLPPLDGAQLAAEAGAHLAAFDSLANQAEQAFGAGRAINHMVLGLMSVPQWRSFQVVHGRHHMKQIRRIRADHHL